MEWTPVSGLDTSEGVINEEAQSAISFNILQSQSIVSPRLREVGTKCNLQCCENNNWLNDKQNARLIMVTNYNGKEYKPLHTWHVHII